VVEAHDWPGNVRELENYVQRALILSPGDVLELPGLPGTGAGAAKGPSRAASADGTFDEEVKALLERVLESTNWRVYGADGAAARLGLKPTTLQGKMSKYGVKMKF
jgi:formate hydrogenlyase transcriptional activator